MSELARGQGKEVGVLRYGRAKNRYIPMATTILATDDEIKVGHTFSDILPDNVVLTFTDRPLRDGDCHMIVPEITLDNFCVSWLKHRGMIEES